MDANTKEGRGGIRVIHAGELRQARLLEYMTSKGISPEVAGRYCHELVVENTRKGGTYTMIGYPTNRGGHLMVSPEGYRFTDHPGITTYDKDGNRTLTESTPEVMVFVKFTDFLWVLSRSGKELMGCDVVVLHSLKNKSRAIPYLQRHTQVYWMFNE